MVAARHKTITTYLEQLSGAGLDVAALDIGPAILRRLVASLDQERSYPSVLLINFGRFHSYVTFIAGRRLMLDRELNYGESQFAQALALALDIDEAHSLELLRHYGLRLSEEGQNSSETLVDFETKQTITEILKPILLDFAEEINKLLVYAASETRGKSVDTVYLLGSAARYPGFGLVLQDILAIPTQVLDPLAHLTDPNKPIYNMSPESASGTAIAVGLALREL